MKIIEIDEHSPKMQALKDNAKNSYQDWCAYMEVKLTWHLIHELEKYSNDHCSKST